MFRNYLKIAFRNLKRNKAYAIINIAGLATGIAACVLIFLVLQFQLSFDNFHPDRDRLYRVVVADTGSNGPNLNDAVSLPWPGAFKQELAQFEYVSGVATTGGDQILIRDGSGEPKKFSQDNVFFVDPDFFSMTGFKFLAGDKNVLSDPNNAILSRATAERMYGSWQNALGKGFRYRNRQDCKVAAIIENPPANTDFNIQMAFRHRNTYFGGFDDWVSISSGSNLYVKLRPGVSQELARREMRALILRHTPDSKRTPLLQPISEVHFDDRYGNLSNTIVTANSRLVLILIGSFLLITACVNFINLATAQAVSRSREIGVRKTLGSTRRQLIVQFMSEMLLITVTAMFIGAIIAIITLPFVNDLIDTRVRLGVANILPLLLFLIGITLVVTILSGFYPAIVLSGFNPVMALKNRITTRTIGGLSLRRVLVVFQFMIAQGLIIGTLVVLKQMNYFRSTPMGYNKESVVNVPVPPDSVSRSRIAVLRQQLLEYPGITMVSASSVTPSDYGHWWSGFRYDTVGETDWATTIKWADGDFFKVYDIPFVAGHNFTTASDSVREFIVNESLVNKLGLKSPQDIIGKRINLWGRMEAPVVGVMKDFHSSSLHSAIAPVLLSSNLRQYGVLNIRLATANVKPAMDYIEKHWNAAYPDYTYSYQFLDDKVASFYREEQQTATVYEIFAGIAIFISCLGLYGLVSFMAVQRQKEMGIRKVMGASVGNILYLFSREFTMLTMIAFVIAAPLAGYFMNSWLENFEFSIHLGAGIFLAAIALSVMIAWITVGGRALSTALANPVKSLKAE
ncbi:ABC transporter permease [Chitinophaga sedimenti]|uniref:ABC transporter permease n=1 Tax=Chitinophaga sedimenti TaxID=2033606 RepID=UPI0020054C11|nr:ABC transporter permease [Chitinophaga sedimenti]MCK7558089.1 ABC transporter permease [Chitinophaga sedimenti]